MQQALIFFELKWLTLLNKGLEQIVNKGIMFNRATKQACLMLISRIAITSINKPSHLALLKTNETLMSKSGIPVLSDYFATFSIDTRWHDNDIYGHVNNVVYYSYFDSIVNRFLIETADLDIHQGLRIGLMVSSQCFYHQSLAFPDALIGALRVNRLGNSSVEYGLAIFKQGEQQASAHGNMTHVFVKRDSQKPMPIDGKLRQVLSSALKSNYSK